MLSLDNISQSTYSLFNNHIFYRMSNNLESPSIATPMNTDEHHLQLPIGHSLPTKSESTFRILSQNINGISPVYDFNKWKETLQSTTTYEVDFLCLSETNLEWKHPKVLNALLEINKSFFQTSRLTTSTSAIRYARMFKPGGVASLVVNEWTGRILGCEHDPTGLGRWNTTKLIGRRNKKLAIINAYQVCHTSIHQSGMNTCFTQQWHLIRSQGSEFPDPRRQFWTDITKCIQQLQTNQFQILLLGDFNTPMDSSTSPLARLCEVCQLVDPVSHLHDTSQQSSYSRGSTIIDFCLMSLETLPCVRKCGYLPLHQFCYSDHRGLFVDFDSTVLFGSKPPAIAKPDTRAVRSTNPQSTATFLTTLNNLWTAKNLKQRTNRLQQTLVASRDGVTPSIRRLAEKIDHDRTRCFLSAEKKCRRRPRPSWSRPLHKLSRKYRYFQIIVSDFKLKRHSFNALCAIQDELQWTPQVHPTSVTEAVEQLTIVKKQLQEIRKTADAHRSRDLQAQAHEAALSGDKEKAKILRRLHKAETTHKAFLKLRRFLKPLHAGGVTKLEIPVNQPDGTTTTEMTEDPAKIEEACLTRNKRHFAQAEGTPFTVHPLSQLESSACGPISDAVLGGEWDKLPFDPTTLPEAQRIILDELRQCCPQIEDTIPLDDFRKRFTIWREDTSTSPSGMYLGLYKSLITGQQHAGTIPEELLQCGEEIFVDIFLLTNLACKFGFAYERWKEVVNCMIHKKIDSFLLDKLRVIHLFEADYNLAIGLIFGRYMIHRACDQLAFHSSQWGRPNRECEDVLMLKELSYQVACMSRTDIATFDNDATACYDRIVSRFALLCCRSYGAPPGACKMTAEVLDNVIHKIKTAYGISDESYYNHPGSPIHGIGQGSQDGPSLWGVDSSVLYKGVDRTSTGVTFVNPTYDVPRPWYSPEPVRALTSSRKLDGFIDDTTGWFNRMLKELRRRNILLNIDELAAGMQADARNWQTFLDISGGKLAITKCLYYLCHWIWTTDGTPSLLDATTIGNLISMNDDPTAEQPPHLDPWTSHLTLGVWKSPAGNYQQQREHLLNKSRKWTASMRAATLTKDEATMSYTRIYIPSLRYGLGTCYLPPKDLLQIQRPAVNAILPKMGFNRHLPRAVVYGPADKGGLGLPSLIFEQGLQQLLFLARHLRSPLSPLRTLFQIGIEWFRMLAGYNSCPLFDTHLDLRHVEFAPWFVSVQLFLRTINHTVDIPNLYCPQILRERDQPIMTLPKAGFSQKELLLVNRCRLFLQVHMVSEICTARGGHLLQEAWRGEPIPHHTTLLLWPRQMRPATTAWRVWRRFVGQLLPAGRFTLYSRSLPLIQPLGQWFEHFHHERRWRWNFSLRHQALLRYDTHDRQYTWFSTHRLRRNWIADQNWDYSDYNLPADAIPCDVQSVGQQICLRDDLTFYAPHPSIVQLPDCPYLLHLPVSNAPVATYYMATTWAECRHQIPTWESQLLPTDIPDGLIAFVQQAHQHRLIIDHCSDGSVSNSNGSFGWAFGPSPVILHRHRGPAFGSPMDSYLAEAYGLLSSLCFWYRILTLAIPVTDTAVIIHFHCDNKSLIHNVNNFIQFPNGSFRRALCPNFDVVYLSACVLAKLPRATLSHVKGHQDSTKPFQHLSWPAQLNVIADKEAAKYVRPDPAPIPPDLPSNQIRLLDSQQRAVTKRWNYHIRTAYHVKIYTSWLCTQFHWTPTTLSDVDFEGFHTAIRILPSSIQRFVIKWSNQALPVRRRAHRYDPSIPPTCRCCPSVTEDDCHLFRCPSTVRRNACATAVEHIQQKLQLLHTAPIIQTSILVLLYQAMDIPSCEPLLSTGVLANQLAIGQLPFLKGRWTRSFRLEQERFYRSQHRPAIDTGDRWIRHAMSCIITEIHHVWKTRNLQNHGADQAEQEQFRRERLLLRIDAIFNQIPNLLSHDRDSVVSISRDDLLSGSNNAIETWLNMVEPTIQCCLQDSQTKLLHHQSDIRDYFDEASYEDSDQDDTTLSWDSDESILIESISTSSASATGYSSTQASSSQSESVDSTYTYGSDLGDI